MVTLIAAVIFMAVILKGIFLIIKFVRKYFSMREEVRKLRTELFILVQFYGKERQEERRKASKTEETK